MASSEKGMHALIQVSVVVSSSRSCILEIHRITGVAQLKPGKVCEQIMFSLIKEPLT